VGAAPAVRVGQRPAPHEQREKDEDPEGARPGALLELSIVAPLPLGTEHGINGDEALPWQFGGKSERVCFGTQSPSFPPP
jgi:hypothetical protein